MLDSKLAVKLNGYKTKIRLCWDPRGGVVVAAEVPRELGALLDVIIPVRSVLRSTKN